MRLARAYRSCSGGGVNLIPFSSAILFRAYKLIPRKTALVQVLLSQSVQRMRVGCIVRKVWVLRIDSFLQSPKYVVSTFRVRISKNSPGIMFPLVTRDRELIDHCIEFVPLFVLIGGQVLRGFVVGCGRGFVAKLVMAAAVVVVYAAI